ncbi:MAG: shikimate dehydrogenase [Pseudomonadota bacterium]
MADLFDFDKAPDEYGVMGNPIAHSKSPQIHAAFAKQTGQRMVYRAILVDPGGLAQAIGNFQANGGKGLNITVPFKQDAYRLADELSPRARLAGAVNTLLIRPDGSVYGDTTDGVGLLRDLRENHHIEIANKEVLLVGAGGAARGVIEPLLSTKPRSLVIANRTVDTALELAQLFAAYGPVRGCGFPELAGQGFDVIINATSASLQGELPPLPEGILKAGAACYDMMYGKEPTPFLRWAQARGVDKLMDGLGMLVEQAAESFTLWRGVRPQTQAVIGQLRREMS